LSCLATDVPLSYRKEACGFPWFRGFSESQTDARPRQLWRFGRDRMVPQHFGFV